MSEIMKDPMTVIDLQTQARASRPLSVAPAPEVLEAIRTEIKLRKLTASDRQPATVAPALVAEQAGAPGIDQGIFYPETALPAHIAALGLAPAKAIRSRPTTGNVRILVLLVDFADNPGNRAVSEYKDMLFSRGTFATGSMYDFYKENSYGQLDIDGDVAGWLRMPQPYAYYVNGNTGRGAYPQNTQKMVEDALAIAAPHVDFSQFDLDGDQFLDGLFVVHAGPGAESDTDTVTQATKIWSHQWNIPQPFVANGVTVYSFLTVPEDCVTGVCCHEFGHMLGLPDLYDRTVVDLYGNVQSEGVGLWCVMGYGSWNNRGYTPSHFCLWSKIKLGWIQPTNVNAAQTLQLAPIEGDGTAGFVVWSGGKPGDEYFLLENRQPLGFDSSQPAGGLLIWHIDDSKVNNNDPADYWVGLMQADGKHQLELPSAQTDYNTGDDGDPYPGSSNNATLDKNSNPNSNDKSGRPTGVSITNIVMNAGVVSCDVGI